jgi:transposase
MANVEQVENAVRQHDAGATLARLREIVSKRYEIEYDTSHSAY